MSSRYGSSKKGKRPEATQWSAWGGWIWSTTYKRYYRQRQDIHGNLETMWGTEHNNATVDSADQPRQQATYDAVADEDDLELANQLNETTLDDPGGDDDEGDYSHRSGSGSGSYPSSSSRDRSGKGKSSTSKSSASKPSRTKSSGKEKYTASEPIVEQEEEEQDAYGPSTRGTTRSPTYDTTSPYAAYSYAEEPSSTTRTHQQYATGAGHSASSRTYQYDQPYDEVEDVEGLAYAQAESLQQQQQAYRGGESSRHQSTRSRYAKAEGDDTSESNRTPRAGQFDISGNEGLYEDLDPRYRVEPSHKFQPGEVFKVLWPEPSGHGAKDAPTISDRQKIPDRYGGSFYVGFRRFIVIANDAGHCTCVPILTYGGKGCKKKGIKPEKHGMVMELRHRARPLDNEPKMGFPPVRLVVEVDGERLAKESRINYSKLVTVEHNVKVFFIGHIYPDDYQLVADAVNICWEDKIHQRKKHSK